MEQNKIKINLHSINKIQRFGQVVRGFISDVRIEANGKELEAKSLLGLFDLNLYDETYTWIVSDNTSEIRKFDAAMEEFI